MAKTAEQRAADKALADEIRAEQAARPVKNEPVAYSNKPSTGTVQKAAETAQANSSSLESQIDEIYARSGGYLRQNQHTDHMN